MRAPIISLFIGITSLFAQTPSYTISTIAGVNPSGDNGPARSARLLRPEGIVVDPTGNVYFCDRGNALIRRIGRDQVITTIAGGGEASAEDGRVATAVRLLDPIGLALNPTSNTLYFSDSTASTVYAVDLATGDLTTVAGDGSAGYTGEGGAAKRARLNSPRGLAYDPTLGLVIADSLNYRVRRVDLTTGVISLVAGSGTPGFSGDRGPALNARLDTPYGVAIGPDRSIFIADWGNGRIRRVSADGILDTVAGNGQFRSSGDGGLATAAGIDGYHVTVAADGTLYLADQVFNRIRRVNPAGVITTLAGSTLGFGGDQGIAAAALFDSPSATALDATGALLIADTFNHRLRRVVLSSGIIDTFAGRNRFGGDAGPAAQALFTGPEDLAYDAAGNLFVADTGNHVVRRIAVNGLVTTVAGVGGEAGRGAENVQATLSRLDNPTSVVVDTDGSLYIADRGNLRVRKVDPSGNIRTITGNDPYGARALALQATQRRLYFTDRVYHQVNRIDLSNPNAIPVAVAGSPSFRAGFSGDGGPAVSALLRFPEGIALAPNGDIYFVDSGNLRLRRIDTAGVITTVAGTGELELTPTDGPVANALLSFPRRVAIDAQGNIFVSETFNRIRRISGGRIATIAGSTGRFTSGFSGDGGLATEARLDTPLGLNFAPDNSLVFADSDNQRLRRLVVNAGPPPIVASRLEIRAGNNQTGTLGQILPQALVVAVTSASGQPIAAAPVAFAVTSGTATVTLATVNTGTDGLASNTVTLGNTAGPIQITVRSGTLTPVIFSLTATASTTQPPVVNPLRPIIARGGIIGVGFSVPAVTNVAPRGIVAIAGQNFLEPGVTGRRVDFASETVNGLLPTRLLGLCVEIGGVRAPMLDAFGTQLNVVVPAIAGPTATVRVIRRCDQPDATPSDPETVPVAAAAPEFLYSQLNADGRNPVAALNAVSGALIGPASLAGFTPARAGDILTVFATGFGATDPTILPGGTSSGIANVTASVRVRIGTTDLAPSDVLYVGASPASLIYQVNLRVPADLSTGNLPFQIFLNGVASPANAYLAIASDKVLSDAPSLAQLLLEQAIRSQSEDQTSHRAHRRVK